MKNLKLLCAATFGGALLLAATSLQAADVKNYQVTGPVLAVTPTSITIQKGQSEWQIIRNADTKLPADVKVGTKVTIYYTMVATEVEVKETKTKK